MQEEIKDVLLLDQNIEDRFIKALLSYPQMAKLVDGHLEPENFSTKLKHNIYIQVLWYAREYESLPTDDILLIIIQEVYGNKQTTLVKRYLAKLEELPVPEWSWIISKLDKWVQTIKLHKTLFEAADRLKEGNLEAAQERILTTLKNAGLERPAVKNDLSLTAEEIQDMVEDENLFCAPTRIYALDDIIKGLFRKELMIVMAPMNVGKSFACVHLAVSALISGKHVLYLTLEMQKERVMQRIFQNISGTIKNHRPDELEKEIERWNDDWTGKELIKVKSLLNITKVAKHLKTLERYGGNLSCKYYASGTCGTQDIEREIMLFDAHFGKPPDLLIVDGLLDIKNRGGIDDRKRQAGLGEITKELRRFASDNNCAVVTTHQANRSGLTADIVGAEHTGEALAVMQIADTALSLNQTRQEALLGKMRIHILRARNQKKWQMVEVWQNLNIGQFAQASKLMSEAEVLGEGEDDDTSMADRLRNRRFNR